MRKYKNKDWLREQYTEKGRTQKDIAKECGVCRTTIHNWVHKFGIQKFLTKEEAQTNPLDWSDDIAYLSGLITSDGNLRKKCFRIRFISKDKGLINQVKEIARNNFIIAQYVPYQRSNDVWVYGFTSRRFYYFLEGIGLMPNKSLKLGKLGIPGNMFYDWLRGEIDGDGCFYIDTKRGDLQLTIYSGSSTFLEWISQELKNRALVNGKGNVNKGNAAYTLRFSNRDSKSIVNAIYEDASYYLQRKYNIVKGFID